MRKKSKGFTLVELLAVIVILAIILVIAIPQILKTINSSRLAAIKSSAELLVNEAEKQYMIDQTESANTGDDLSAVKYGGIGTKSSGADRPCTFLTELSINDYDVCNMTVTNEGVATLNELTGKGKFKGYSCTGTKHNICCSRDGEESTCNNGSGSGNNEPEGPTGKYLVTTTTMYLSGEPSSTLEPEGVDIRNTPAAAMNDWKLITEDNSTRPFYIKYKIENITGWFPDWDSNREYFYESESECLEDGFELCATQNFDKIIESYVEFVITDELKTQLKSEYCNESNIYYESIEACEATYDNLVNGTYTLRGGVDESGLASTPIFDANVETIKTAFNYTVQPNVCTDSAGFNCYVNEGLNVYAFNNGNIEAYDNVVYGCSVIDGRFGCQS